MRTCNSHQIILFNITVKERERSRSLSFSLYNFFLVSSARAAATTRPTATTSWQRLLSGDWRCSPIDQSRAGFYRAPSCPYPSTKRPPTERPRKRTTVSARRSFHPCTTVSSPSSAPRMQSPLPPLPFLPSTPPLPHRRYYPSAAVDRRAFCGFAPSVS